MVDRDLTLKTIEFLNDLVGSSQHTVEHTATHGFSAEGTYIDFFETLCGVYDSGPREGRGAIGVQTNADGDIIGFHYLSEDDEPEPGDVSPESEAASHSATIHFSSLISGAVLLLAVLLWSFSCTTISLVVAGLAVFLWLFSRTTIDFSFSWGTGETQQPTGPEDETRE